MSRSRLTSGFSSRSTAVDAHEVHESFDTRGEARAILATVRLQFPVWHSVEVGRISIMRDPDMCAGLFTTAGSNLCVRAGCHPVR